jgi:hypothetical protein
MDTPATIIESLYEKGEAYGKTSLELAKLKSIESASRISSTLVSRLCVIIMFTLFALTFNIGVALWIGALLGRAYYGFFIVAGFYLLIGVLFHYTLYGWIKKPLSDLIISQALQD